MSLHLDSTPWQRRKPGMVVCLWYVTERKENVLTVSDRKERGGGRELLGAW